MKIFFDFDDTLFDTSAFSEGLQRIFGEYGTSEEVFWESYREMKKECPTGGWSYSPEKHIEKIQMQRGISFDKDVIRKKLMMYFADTKRFLFLDTEESLSTLSENGHILYILSFGDKDFQMAKVSGTGMGSFLEKVIVTDTDKAEAMRREIGVHDEVWFLDDKIHFIESVKKAFPYVRTILVRRKEDQHCKEKSSEFCDYVVRDLRKALEIIKG